MNSDFFEYDGGNKLFFYDYNTSESPLFYDPVHQTIKFTLPSGVFINHGNTTVSLGVYVTDVDDPLTHFITDTVRWISTECSFFGVNIIDFLGNIDTGELNIVFSNITSPSFVTTDEIDILVDLNSPHMESSDDDE